MLFIVSLAILIFTFLFQIIRRFGGLFDSILRRFDLLKLKSSNIWEVEPLKIIKYIFLFSIIVIFSLLFYQSWRQYQVWSQNELSKFLLPPYQSIAYFLGYSFTHFFKNYLISLVIALLFLPAAVFLNKKFQERFFEKEEPYLGALAIFLVGHPLWMYYIIAILIIGVLGTLFLRIINLRTSDVPRGSTSQTLKSICEEVEPPKIETNLSILRGRTSDANKNQSLGSPTSRTSNAQILTRFPLYHFWLPIAILVLIIGKILL